VSQYKKHPIYGIGVRRADAGWHCRGLVFDPDDKVTEIKKLEPDELSFKTLAKAEAYALQLCKNWIDAKTDGNNDVRSSVIP